MVETEISRPTPNTFNSWRMEGAMYEVSAANAATEAIVKTPGMVSLIDDFGRFDGRNAEIQIEQGVRRDRDG